MVLKADALSSKNENIPQVPVWYKGGWQRCHWKTRDLKHDYSGVQESLLLMLFLNPSSLFLFTPLSPCWLKRQPTAAQPCVLGKVFIPLSGPNRKRQLPASASQDCCKG